MMVSRRFSLRMRNVSGQTCKENKTLFLCPLKFFFDNHAIYEVMWKSIIERDRPEMTCALHAGHLRPQTLTRPV